MADWSDLEDPPAPLAPVVDAEIVPDDEPSQLDRIRALEDEVLVEALAVTRDVVNFADIAPDQKEPPEEWVRELGEAKAMKRFRHMQAAWCGSKVAPVALGISASTAAKIVKARSVERAAPRALAIVYCAAPGAPMPKFEVRNVDED